MENSPGEAIRAAVAAGEFEHARSLWDGYVTSMHDEIGRGALTQDRLAEAGALVEWCRVVALCARTHAQHCLDNLRVAGEYERAPAEAARRVETRA